MLVRAIVIFGLLATFASTSTAAIAPGLPAPRLEAFPMPDGSTELRDERDVGPWEAAWKAAAAARAGKAAVRATPNQQGWDARWYGLDLTFTPATTSVSGTVTIRATVGASAIATMDLDLYANMVVDAVKSGGLGTTYSRAGNVLTVNLDRTYQPGETMWVDVTYHGQPSAAGYFGFPIANGRQLIWSLSEAYGARTWWPCKDAPEDKADSVSMRFTVPSGLTTVSNGTLRSTTNNGPTVTTHWVERYPIVTYLVSIASYPYTTSTDWYVPSPADSMPLTFFMFPESAPGAAPVHARVKDMLAAYATRFGEYPFLEEKYGHAQFTFGGGMEHQTCSSMGTYNESVVAHELTHQWWGDLVTCRDFHHIWLNEGFATYGEALWAEANGGTAAYKADLELNKFFGPGTIWVPDATNESRVFDFNLSYNKGSWVLHMLRHVLGDAVFFDALLAYRAAHGYGTAVTEDFRDVCEAVSGRDLDAFFQQWIYGEYYPKYRVTWASAPAAGGWDVSVRVDQTQSWQLFNMPVDVRVTTAAGDTTFVVRDSLASQTFVLHVPAEPQAVALDPDGWILRTVETPVTNPTFDRPVLLVNGVDWASYGTEITSAYADKAFSGQYAVDFWDVFAGPAGGYPGTLPAPLGHGAVPPDVMGRYRNVIWVGNNFGGDLSAWLESPVHSYLKAGGNLLLLSRMGDQFLVDSLRTYLGINWALSSVTLNDCIATRPGFTSMARLGTQSTCSVFDTVRTTSESHLIFRAASGFTPSRGIGAVRVPAGGAGSRPAGGRLAFVSGRPYRWDHAQLQANVAEILTAWFGEPVNGVGAPGAGEAARLALEAPRPNPARGATRLAFTLPRAARVRVQVLDVSGRLARVLADRAMVAGPHEIAWDGRGEDGAPLPAGLYWARVDAGGEQATRRLVRLR